MIYAIFIRLALQISTYSNAVYKKTSTPHCIIYFRKGIKWCIFVHVLNILVHVTSSLHFQGKSE